MTTSSSDSTDSLTTFRGGLLKVSVPSTPSSKVIDSYNCMHEVVRKIFVVSSLAVAFADQPKDWVGYTKRAGFLSVGSTLWIVSSVPLRTSIIESAFVCMNMGVPKTIIKDDFPDSPCDFEITSDTAATTLIHSTVSMLTDWQVGDIVPLRGDEVDYSVKPDHFVDVKAAAGNMSKYLKRPPSGEFSDRFKDSYHSGLFHQSPEASTVAAPASQSVKKMKDARDFREQIISNGAQAEFFVWNHIKAVYGDAAQLCWWLTSTKRTFFPNDLTPIDDAAGADFLIPSDTKCLFAVKRGGPVQVEVKGTGRTHVPGNPLSFEISRNELQTATEAQLNGDEYVVVVVSGVAGFGRPQLETIVRDVGMLDLVPNRFIATVKAPNETVALDHTGTTQKQPNLTKSSWY